MNLKHSPGASTVSSKHTHIKVINDSSWGLLGSDSSRNYLSGSNRCLIKSLTSRIWPPEQADEPAPRSGVSVENAERNRLEIRLVLQRFIAIFVVAGLDGDVRLFIFVEAALASEAWLQFHLVIRFRRRFVCLHSAKAF